MSTRTEVKADLAERIAKAMYIQPNDINEDDLFSDFGLESVTLAKIVVGICETYGCTITIGEFLEHQTLRAAADFVSSRVENQVNVGS